MRFIVTLTIGAIALTALVAPSAAFARDDAGTKSHAAHGAAAKPTTAAQFVDHAARDGMAEVQLGKLALSRAQSADVKQFAQRMIDDHGKANAELAQLATSKNLDPPTTLDSKHRALEDRLRRLSGSEFDRAYMQAMLQDHDHAIETFRLYAERGDDPALQRWAAETLPTLRSHEQMARETASKIGVQDERAGADGAGQDGRAGAEGAKGDAYAVGTL